MDRKIAYVVIIVIGIAVVIIAVGQTMAYFRDQEIKALLESKKLIDAEENSRKVMESSNKTREEAEKTLDAIVRGFD
jgi:hypothetical protein